MSEREREREGEREVGAMEGNIRGIVIYFQKITSEMDVAPRYTLLALFTLFLLLKLPYTAQCAFWVVRWPCGQMTVAVKTHSHGKIKVLRLFFLNCFRTRT